MRQSSLHLASEHNLFVESSKALMQGGRAAAGVTDGSPLR